MAALDSCMKFLRENQDRFLEELFSLLRIPSVSTDERHKQDVVAGARFLRDRFEEAGLDDAQIFPTEGHPIVYAQKITDPTLPVVLVYGHYDVQPPQPLDLWHRDPFDPCVVDKKIVARGASDDKGQMYLHIKAVEAMIRTESLACNVKFLIEGEEEVGSPHLEPFIKNHKELLASDVVLISDTAILGPNLPSLAISLRGIAYLEVTVSGADRDLHSGVYGGTLLNPLHTIGRLIASLHHPDGSVAVPGFYEGIKQVADYVAPEFDKSGYCKDIGIEKVFGEPGYSTPERNGIRPCLDVNGVYGGYQGEGAKTVIPACAGFKLSARIVDGQHGAGVARLIEKHLQRHADGFTKLEVRTLHYSDPVVLDRESSGYKAAEKALEEVWNQPVTPTWEGGSIPVATTFGKVLGRDVVMMGFGLNSDAIHSPNESFQVDHYFKGMEAVVGFHHHFARLCRS